MLDSGAYTAWSHGETLDVRDYIKYVKQVKDLLWMYVNMDVIPGSIERPRSLAEVEASAAASYQNLQRMRDAGLRPLPVFHQGEDFAWLDRMLADGEKYIGISTAKNSTPTTQEQWLDRFFTTVTDAKGRPFVRVHGFGSATVRVLRRYPFYSVDSAGWAIAGGYSKIYVPPYVNGAFDYLGDPMLIGVSNRLRIPGQFDNFGDHLQELIRRFLVEEIGCHIGNIRHDRYWRWLAVAKYYRNVTDRIVGRPFNHKVAVFDRGGKSNPSSYSDVGRPLIFVYSSHQYDSTFYDVLRSVGATHDLLSYYELRKRPQTIADYLRGGFSRKNKRGLGKLSTFSNSRYLDFRARKLMQRLGEDGSL